MARQHDPNALATARDVERVVATMAELSFDLQRSVCSAVPVALSEALGAEVDAAQLERAGAVIFAEIAARYRVAAAATLIALGSDHAPR